MGSSLSFFMITFFFSSLHLPFFLSKKPCVWSLFSPSNLSWGSKNTTLSRNYLWVKLLTTCAHNAGQTFLNSLFCFYSSTISRDVFFLFFFIMIDQKSEKDLMIGVKEYNFDIRKIFSPLKRLARSQNHPFIPTLYLESFLCSLSAAPYI